MALIIDFQAFRLFKGMKTRYIDSNPEVCLQVEQIHTPSHWSSVIVMGRAERLTEKQDIDRTVQLMRTHNPTLSPALNRTWLDAWDVRISS